MLADARPLHTALSTSLFTLLLAGATLAVTPGCGAGTPASADSATKEKDKDKAAEAEEGDAAPEKTEAEKEAEAKAKLVERQKKQDEENAAEVARWTDELRASAAELAERDFASTAEAMPVILASPHRMPKNVERDGHRHPAQTLEFFGITPEMTVVEVGPGAGWYTEILAPLLAKKGKLSITDFDPAGPDDKSESFYAKRMQSFLARSPQLFGKVERLVQEDFSTLKLGEDESADVVLLARALHGWQRKGDLAEHMKEVHRILKPGGVVAVIQHRAKEGADLDESAKKGYLPQAWLVEQMTTLGFELADSSEINANAKDTADYEEGVWTLPPSLALGDKDRDKYIAIGESDRMTLKFAKKS